MLSADTRNSGSIIVWTAPRELIRCPHFLGGTMRTLLVLTTLSAVACGSNMSSNSGDDANSNPIDAPGTTGDPVAFEVTSTDFTLTAGTEVTKCFYFTTSNTDTVAVHKWTSMMTTGSHHMIVFLNPPGVSQPPDGTIDSNCSVGNASGGAQPIWTYASQTAGTLQTEDLPANDGAGKPLAQNIAAHTSGYIQMHYLNPGDTDLTVHVNLKAYALPAGTAYTQTEAYITYQYQINIPAGATNVVVPGSCPVPAGVKFWQLSTHAHKQAVDTQVKDGTSMVFESMDWEHPGAKLFDPAFYSFGAPKLNWQCTYNNTGDNAGHAITQGASAQTNEMCMATGYMFPATAPQFCVGLGPTNCQCL